MKIKAKKARSVNNGQPDEGSATETSFKIFILSIGATAILLLFPSLSKLSVFAKGEFAYPESIGIIFALLTLFSIFTFFLPKMFHKLRTVSKFLRYVIFTGAVGLIVFCMMLVITFTWIRYDVKSNCEAARKDYGGTCREALSRQLEDANRGFRSRNSAIWTLGQLADKNSLPVLKKYYTGRIPEREPLNKTISQYELKKAITWCEMGNITSWMYKGL